MTTAITFPTVKTIESLRTVSISIVSEETKADALAHLAKVRLAARQLKADVTALTQPYQDEIDKIKLAAKSWANLLTERDQAVEQAVLAYTTKTRKAVQTYNVKALDRYEDRVDKNEEKAVEAGKPIPVTLPPALKAEPPKTVYTEEARMTESGHWTWDGIRGVEDGQKGAKELTFPEARRLKLDLPEEWFYLETALVTACVRRNDRVPSCVLNRFQPKIVVTATR